MAGVRTGYSCQQIAVTLSHEGSFFDLDQCGPQIPATKLRPKHKMRNVGTLKFGGNPAPKLWCRTSAGKRA
jgi:hypothetical protein